MVEKWTVTQGDITAAENDAAVQVNGVNLVDPIYIHTLDDNQTIRVHFTNLVQYDAKISGTNGTGKFTYTTPIQPNDTGAVNSASAQVRKNGTVKLTLAPSANCVGTAEEIKSELQKAAPNAVVSVTEKDGSFEAVIRNVTDSSGGQHRQSVPQNLRNYGRQGRKRQRFRFCGTRQGWRQGNAHRCTRKRLSAENPVADTGDRARQGGFRVHPDLHLHHAGE